MYFILDIVVNNFTEPWRDVAETQAIEMYKTAGANCDSFFQLNQKIKQNNHLLRRKW